MNRTYKELTQVNFRHDYYSDEKCPDFELVPTPETQRLLQKFRCLFGSQNQAETSGYVVYQECANGSVLLPLPSSFQMAFGLHLKNSDLLNFTDLGVPNSREVFFFENPGLNGNQLQKMELCGAIVAWDGVAGNTLEVVAKLRGGAAEKNADTFTESSVLQVRLDLEGLPFGIYDLYEDANQNPSKTIYYHTGLNGSKTWGIVHLSQSPSLGLEETYTIALASRSETWRYFLVLKGTHTGYDYSIYDSNEPVTLNFSDPVTAVYSLTSADIATQGMLSEMYGSGASVKIFVSKDPLTYQEQARSLITLGRKKTVEAQFQPLIKNLPNPAVGDPAAAIIVGIDPPILES